MCLNVGLIIDVQWRCASICCSVLCMWYWCGVNCHGGAHVWNTGEYQYAAVRTSEVKGSLVSCCVLIFNWSGLWCDSASRHLINLLLSSGHYMYRTVVTICTTQWSLYVPHSGHCRYRTVVTICTAQWSLYVPHSGHYMYRTVVTICTAQWSLYVPHSGHYMYRTVVTICTTSLTSSNSTFCPTVHLCVLCGSENKQRLFPYTALTDWFV